MVKIATLVGCAIGDALGNPFEMKPASNPAIKEWDGMFKAGGTFWVGEPGQYTDDTLMSIALSTSLIEKNGFDPEDVAKKYLAWYDSGNTRGIGSTTASALMRFKLGATWQESGLTHNPDRTPVGGNGTAMRAAPLGIWYRKNPDKLLEVAMADASITHNSLEPKMGSVAVALCNALLTNGVLPEEALDNVIDILADSAVKDKLVMAQALLKDRADPTEALALIGTHGYVPSTVGAAFYCLCATDCFEDVVVMAVRGGGDTDTTAAIAGAMAGTHYGLEGIPGEYTEKVENFDLLQSLTDELVNNET
jgi:ADP-ribosyl-[dinitrogen reductase] hydrolase